MELNKGKIISEESPKYEISLSSRTKSVNNPNDSFPIEKCCDAIIGATKKTTNWTEICTIVA